VATLTLERIGSGFYRLANVGTLRTTRRHGALIESGGRRWELSRALLGLGQIQNAVDQASGERVARYVPGGPLHLHGIQAGVIEVAGRRYGWRAERQWGSRFLLSDDGRPLALLEAGPPAQPVAIELEHATTIEPMILLLCCHLVIAAAYATDAGLSAAIGVATGG